MLKQISLFLENKPGRLAYVCRVMGQEGINIRALSVADTTDFGVLRLIVDNPSLAEEKLKARGFLVNITDVAGIKIEDRPGGLADALEKLGEENIAVEYVYAFLNKCGDQAMVILRLSDNERAAAALRKRGIPMMTEEEAYRN
ncbi:MAG: ACT domain-containing protein [Peptococcaceae bacterium]|jgi:hypothetical protein|nr:ACT domain-containing protein [Peptococcaceae bacterium]